IVSLGVPGVLSVQASVEFGIDVTLSGALTLGINLDPQYLGQIGLVAPTYIEPHVGLSATLTGEVQVVGFDLAKLAGTATLGFDLAYGLDQKNTNSIVPFANFFNDSDTNISGTLDFGIEADLLGLKVWSWTSPTIGLISVQQGRTVLLEDPNGTPVLTVLKGSDPVGHPTIDASPNLVIDPANSNALYVQAVNARRPAP